MGAEFSLDYNKSILTLKTKNFPLEKILKKISEKADFRLKLNGQFSKIVSIEIINKPVEAALRRLAGEHHIIVLFGKDGNKEAIKEVWVYQKSKSQNLARNDNIPEADVDLIKESSPSENSKNSNDFNKYSGYTDNTNTIATDSALIEAKIAELALIGTEEAVTTIASTLGHRNPKVRKFVAEQLGQMEHEQAILTLGQILLGDSDATVRLAAVEALANKSNEAAKMFLEAATKDNNRRVQKAAQDAL